MFSILACKVKQNAPRCHTYLEIIYTRYGRVAHLVFMLFAFVTNVLVGSQLLLGGSAVVTALTGMNVYAAIFLIPTGRTSSSKVINFSYTDWYQVSVHMSSLEGSEPRSCVIIHTL